VGIVGTSWWSDAMYFPALASHPIGRFTAVCGRDKERTRAAAARWNVAHAFTDWKAMLDSNEIDAVIVASTNESHFPITMAALERRLPVLCEKPIAMNTAEAIEMAAAAREAQITTMVPFTYRWMPSNQYVKQLLNEGYIGHPYHLNMRYYAGYARSSDYAWRFDNEKAGAGILGDLGAHWLDMARWFLGEIAEVSATTSRFVTRRARPDGSDYPRGEDSAVLMARFESGALAILQTSAVCWEGTPFGQTHLLDLHGSDGTLYATNDWDHVQQVRGVRAGEQGPAHVLDIPDALWGGAPHAPVHDTYRHIFRRTEAMTRGWVTAIAEGRFVEPDLTTGARVQQLIGAGLASVAADGQWQYVPAS
jgi:predicted dehydrogenase